MIIYIYKKNFVFTRIDSLETKEQFFIVQMIIKIILKSV